MDDPAVLYMVRVWIDPENGAGYLEYLETRHMAQVIQEPGFLWARKCRLEESDGQGWPGFLLVYGLDSQEALRAYLVSPARDRFWKELAAFADVQHAERFYGSVDFALN